MFRRNTIKSAVKKVLNERLDEAQRICDAEVANLASEKKDSSSRAREALVTAFGTFFAELARIKQSFQNRRAEVVSRHVNSVLAKIS